MWNPCGVVREASKCCSLNYLPVLLMKIIEEGSEVGRYGIQTMLARYTLQLIYQQGLSLPPFREVSERMTPNWQIFVQ